MNKRNNKDGNMKKWMEKINVEKNKRNNVKKEVKCKSKK